MDPANLIRALTRSPGRGACTDAERRAATLLHDALRGSRRQAWVETEWVRPQWPGALALGALIAIAGSLTAASEPEIGLGLALGAALLLAIEASGRPGPLRWIFPRRATQTVLVEPADPEPIALLVCARTDATRGGFAARHPALTRVGAAVAALLVAGAAGARLADVEGLALGIAQFAPTVFLLLALAAAVDTALATVASGPGDGAAAVAAAVTAHAELVARPPDRLSAGLVLHGAATGDPIALRRLLKRDGRQGHATVLVSLEAAPQAGYATRHPQLVRAAEHLDVPRRRGAPHLLGLPAIELAVVDPDAAVDATLTLADALDAELVAIQAAQP